MITSLTFNKTSDIYQLFKVEDFVLQINNYLTTPSLQHQKQSADPVLQNRKKKRRCTAHDVVAAPSLSLPSESPYQHPVEKIPLHKFAALRLIKYSDEIPQIGMVVKVTDLEVEVEWMLGSYASVWTPWKPKDKSNIERVHRNAVIMSGIELTKTKRLKTDDIRTLKLIYSNVELM